MSDGRDKVVQSLSQHRTKGESSCHGTRLRVGGSVTGKGLGWFTSRLASRSEGYTASLVPLVHSLLSPQSSRFPWFPLYTLYSRYDRIPSGTEPFGRGDQREE